MWLILLLFVLVVVFSLVIFNRSVPETKPVPQPNTEAKSNLPSLYQKSAQDIAYINVIKDVPVYGKNFPDGKTIFDGVEYGEVEVKLIVKPDGMGLLSLRGRPKGTWDDNTLIPPSIWKLLISGNKIIFEYPDGQESVVTLETLHKYLPRLDKVPEVGDLEMTAYLGEKLSTLRLKQILPFDGNPYPDYYA